VGFLFWKRIEHLDGAVIAQNAKESALPTLEVFMKKTTQTIAKIEPSALPPDDANKSFKV